MSFIKYGKLFCHDFFKYLFSPFSSPLGTSTILTLICLGVPLCYFHSFFFLLSGLDKFDCHSIQVLLFFTSACSNMLLNPSSEFFHFSYCTFHCRISIWFFLKNNFYFLLSFPICSYIVTLVF